MEIKVIDKTGKETGRTVQLNGELILEQPNDHAIYLDIKRLLAAQRQGTHKSKQRAEIARTTKKLKKQKGTGGARAGSMKSPLFRGGGRVFGPVPRDYDIKVNKKTRSLARKSAFTHKVNGNALYVIEEFSTEQPKTKEFISIYNSLVPENSKALFVFAEPSKNVVLSSRNIQKAFVKRASDISTFDILNNEKMYITEGALETFKTLFN